MKKIGDTTTIAHWGKFTAVAIAELKKPVRFYHKETGEYFFKPTIIKIEWEHAPDFDKCQFWFPFWTHRDGREVFGRAAPMIDESSLLELLTEAINQGFFSGSFLRQLGDTVREKSESK